MNPESRLRQRLSERLKTAGAFVQCVESGMTGFGIPDVYVAYNGLVAWVELKADLAGTWPCKRAVTFRAGQRAWAAANEKHGGHSFLGINYGNGFLLTRTMAVDRTTLHPVPEYSLFVKRIDGHEWLSWMQEEVRKEAIRGSSVY
jgi:hypothetical protein